MLRFQPSNDLSEEGTQEGETGEETGLHVEGGEGTAVASCGGVGRVQRVTRARAAIVGLATSGSGSGTGSVRTSRKNGHVRPSVLKRARTLKKSWEETHAVGTVKVPLPAEGVPLAEKVELPEPDLMVKSSD